MLTILFTIASYDVGMAPDADDDGPMLPTAPTDAPAMGRSRFGGVVLLLQLLLVAGAGAMIVAPPASGAMMLVPLGPQAANALPLLALVGDVRLLARGPLPGSLLVYGKRRAHTLLRHGIVTFASPPALCGSGTSRG